MLITESDTSQELNLKISIQAFVLGNKLFAFFVVVVLT